MNKHKVLGLIIQGEKNDVLRKQSYGLRNLYVWANAVCLKQSRQPFREILWPEFIDMTILGKSSLG